MPGPLDVWLCLPQGVLLTGAMLEILTCGEGGASELSKILLVPEKQRPLLQAYRSAVCSGGEGQRSERFRLLSVELREQINPQSVTEKVQQIYIHSCHGLRLFSFTWHVFVYCGAQKFRKMYFFHHVGTRNNFVNILCVVRCTSLRQLPLNSNTPLK